MRTRYAAVLTALVAGVATSSPATAQDAQPVLEVCGDCHAGVEARYMDALDHAAEVTCLSCHHLGFSNDPEVTQARRREVCVSCHADQEPVAMSHVGVADVPSCMDCHTVHGGPSPADVGVEASLRCSSCHVDTGHTLHAGVVGDAPVCADCHVSHTGEAFQADGRALTAACGSCHVDTHPSHANVEGDFLCTTCHTADGPPATASALEAQCATCHAEVRPTHARVESPTPSCLECHDFGAEASLGTLGTTMSENCAACHADVADHYAAGGHALGLGDDPNPDLPTCVTCHAAHIDAGEERSYLRLAATVACMECHSKEILMEEYGLPRVAPSYEDDFHGATARFMWSHPEAGEELPPIMVCSDCHGAHDVGWSESDVVADVCRQCHEESDDYLAGAWLGHGDIGPRNQPLIFLIKLGYYFLIPFMLGGLFINIMFHLLSERKHGARVMKTAGMQRLMNRLKGKGAPEEEMVTRFSLTDRLDHLGSAVTFILLVVTGLPQTRPDLPAARWLIGLMGGIGTTRLIHRIIGFTFVVLMVMHVARGVRAAIKHKRLPVMVPARKDFEDILQTFRHYLFGEKKARFDKFEFGEKFEYWGLFLGGIVMSTTGVILVFPELVTQFLPGIVVAATRTIHGFEATFAVMVVILWHSWGVMLRPEIFPLDTSIFSGKISVSRLKAEHPAEYDRLFPERAAAEPDERDDDVAHKGILPGPEEGIQGT